MLDRHCLCGRDGINLRWLRKIEVEDERDLEAESA
jgi:hypothetical protein